jgi:hypothetical protein
VLISAQILAKSTYTSLIIIIIIIIAIVIPVRKKSNLNEFFEIAKFGSIHKTVKIQ